MTVTITRKPIYGYDGGTEERIYVGKRLVGVWMIPWGYNISQHPCQRLFEDADRIVYKEKK